MINVLLLGDSIRIGYQQFVRNKLKAVGVDFPRDSGRFSSQFLYYIPHWKQELGFKKYDVIHFNVGLWDVVRLDNESDCCFISLDEYLSNVNRIVERLKWNFCPRKIIFATTTQVEEGCNVFTDGGGDYWNKK